MFETLREAADTAQRKARYSCYDWIALGKDGAFFAGRLSAETVKAAMLATGTQEFFMLYGSRDGHSYIIRWPVANNIRRRLIREGGR